MKSTLTSLSMIAFLDFSCTQSGPSQNAGDPQQKPSLISSKANSSSTHSTISTTPKTSTITSKTTSKTTTVSTNSSSTSTSSISTITGPTPANFHIVDDKKLYRSARPEADTIQYLKQLGIKTIISLEEYLVWEIEEERKYVEAAGIRFIHYPIGTLIPPSVKDLETALSDIINPQNQPVLVHCLNGSDRTGEVVATYRIRIDGWPIQKAVDELRDPQFSHAKYLYWWDPVLCEITSPPMRSCPISSLP